MINKSNTVGIAYVPVLHKGYLEFFSELEKNGVEQLYLISDEILESHEELDYINRKDRLRAVPLIVMLKGLEAVTDLSIEILTESVIGKLKARKVSVHTPAEDIGKHIAESYFKDHEVQYSNIFLRLNKDGVGEDKLPETSGSVTLTEFQRTLVDQIIEAGEKSSDWWRQVGAALVKDGKVVSVVHNEHLPEEQLPNIIGDARSLFKKGIHINYVTTAHAEITLIADAARRGISTEGAEIYMTDFPCPYCARAIVKSGVKKIYFLHGYAVLDGDKLFKEYGIEVVKVTLD